PQDVDRDRPMIEFGLSSVDAVELAGLLEELLGRTLPATLLWEYPTINALTAALTREASDEAGVRAVPAAVAGAQATEPIAIIGLGCRFPGGADDPDGLWRLLTDGRDAVRTVPPERWRPFGNGSPAQVP